MGKHYFRCMVYNQVYDSAIRIVKIMKNRKKAYVIGIALLLSALVLFVPTQPAKAQFVLAYTFSPDNYGNGISYISAYFDGDWNGSMYKDPYNFDIPPETTTNPMETFEGTNITLGVFCWLNGTYAGISSLVEGKTVLKHNVSVLHSNGTVIFSQQNFTYISGADSLAPMYFYRYDVILDFAPVSGVVYTVTVIYEVFGM